MLEKWKKCEYFKFDDTIILTILRARVRFNKLEKENEHVHAL